MEELDGGFIQWWEEYRSVGTGRHDERTGIGGTGKELALEGKFNVSDIRERRDNILGRDVKAGETWRDVGAHKGKIWIVWSFWIIDGEALGNQMGAAGKGIG